MITPPVRGAWYMAHAKALDAVWGLARPSRKRKIEHIDVLKDLFARYGAMLFPDATMAPALDRLAVEMYNVRNDAGHGRVKAKRPLTTREIIRGQDLTVSLGRLVLLELADVPTATAIDWVTRGSRWMR